MNWLVFHEPNGVTVTLVSCIFSDIFFIFFSFIYFIFIVIFFLFKIFDI